ncbi:MAG: retroviral-like aspartic protease family protein [Elusimicrobia bacterium]|nr:retroviral-like aspartic protease family protein [Elusimicrobiota bacterium]
MTYVKAKVANPYKINLKINIRFLVDTGAYLSIVPADILNKLGVKSFTKRLFRLANGQHIIRQIGTVRFYVGKYLGESEVIFGYKKDEPILGVVALESLGLAVDPRTQTLKPIEMYLMVSLKTMETKF